MTNKATNCQIKLLLEVYDQAYDHIAWHGTNLRGSLKGLKINELLYRPQPKRHNIWEIALHCAYWKYVVLRRMIGGKKGDFPRKPSNFPRLPKEPTLALWKEDLALLEDIHQKLREAIEIFPESKLYKTPENSKVSFIATIYGAASHDLYHAGQIQLLKRMARMQKE